MSNEKYYNGIYNRHACFKWINRYTLLDWHAPVLENIWQRQQHRCKEIFNKLSLPDIILHLIGNFCHLIYILECYIIHLLFKNSKSVLQVENVLCRDWSLSQCATPYVLWNLHMQEVLYLTYTGNFYFWILLPGREIYFLGLPIYNQPKKLNTLCWKYHPPLGKLIWSIWAKIIYIF